MVNVNLNNEPYVIIGSFHILEKDGTRQEYIRVRFHRTKNEQVVKAELVKSGEFVDIKDLVDKREHGARVDIVTQQPLTEIKEEKVVILDEPEPYIEEPVVVNEPEVETRVIIVTTPKDNKIEIPEDELEAYCEENKLDIEIVQKVLNGEQKTHRKYRFKFK